MEVPELDRSPSRRARHPVLVHVERLGAIHVAVKDPAPVERVVFLRAVVRAVRGTPLVPVAGSVLRAREQDDDVLAVAVRPAAPPVRLLDVEVPDEGTRDVDAVHGLEVVLMLVPSWT